MSTEAHEKIDSHKETQAIDELLAAKVWPAADGGKALQALVQASELPTDGAGAWSVPPLPDSLASAEGTLFDVWLAGVARQIGVEVEATHTTYGEVQNMLQRAAPALLRLSVAGEICFLALLRGGHRRSQVVAPDGSVQRLSTSVIRTALTQDLEQPVLPAMDALLAEAGVPAERRERAKAAMLREQLGDAQVPVGWLLRTSPATPFWQQIRRAKVPTQMSLMVIAFAFQQAIIVLSGWMIIEGTLHRYFAPALLFGWGALLIVSLVFQIAVFTSQREIVMRVGALFKQRLLFGTLQLRPEEIRHQGVGQFLGRVMESQSVEELALAGGFAALISIIQLFSALIVLTVGSDGFLYALLLLGWLVLTLLVGWRYFYHNRAWITHYRDMTNDLVERMVGHRTRLAQEDLAHWHDDEEQILVRYLMRSNKMDRVGIQLSALVNRGWLILSLGAFVFSFLRTPLAATELTVILGGILLAAAAFSSLATGIVSVIQILNAWDQFGPLFQAATRAREQAHPVTPLAIETAPDQPLVLARDLHFGYRTTGSPVLDGCDFRIAPGDRLLLEGPSGGGKSTLAALLTGLRRPQAGLLLLHGLDITSLGEEAWRQRVIAAPQFHENHVLTETFGFNLLMGRGWPPSAQDLRDAHQICHELGLGELLARMPAGMQQMVGESGWQLSHGERSRLYIARALLQNADLIILDESFAALDPENLERALRCVLHRAPTLLVIAHP